MKNGCTRDVCVNVHCKNNPNFKPFGSDSEMLTAALKLWKSYNDDRQFNYWEICCDTDYMKNTYKTLQKENFEQFTDYHFLVEFVGSPYAFSLSFLKDPTIIGKNDEFG